MNRLRPQTWKGWVAYGFVVLLIVGALTGDSEETSTESPSASQALEPQGGTVQSRGDGAGKRGERARVHLVLHVEAPQDAQHLGYVAAVAARFVVVKGEVDPAGATVRLYVKRDKPGSWGRPITLRASENGSFRRRLRLLGRVTDIRAEAAYAGAKPAEPQFTFITRRRSRAELAQIRERREQARAERELRRAQAAEETPAPAAPAPAQDCHPSYDPCLDPNASDYDCEGGSGDGPMYTGFVTVKGPDEYGLDSDGDGTGCES
jgi:hypothetical protein